MSKAVLGDFPQCFAAMWMRRLDHPRHPMCANPSAFCRQQHFLSDPWIPGAGKDEEIEQAELPLEDEEQVIEEKKELNDTHMEDEEKITDEDVHDGM